MHKNLATSLDRAEELLQELSSEYQASLRAKIVSDRAVQLTHDVCEKLRGILDRVARRYWEIHVSPALTESERKAASVYFPIASNREGLDSILGRWRWKSVRDDHQLIYDYFSVLQPFAAAKNAWLGALNEISVQGKHIDLLPQRRIEDRRVTVSGAGGTVSYGPGVTFGPGVRILGAPIDPRTQRIIPTQDVTERVEIWVSFLIEGYNFDALSFCQLCSREVRGIAFGMSDLFKL